MSDILYKIDNFMNKNVKFLKGKYWTDPNCYNYSAFEFFNEKITNTADDIIEVFGSTQLNSNTNKFSIDIIRMKTSMAIGVIDTELKVKKLLLNELNWIFYKNSK